MRLRSSLGYGTVSNSTGHLVILQSGRACLRLWLDISFAESFKRMIGFRNIA
jgi:hypothetical protein